MHIYNESDVRAIYSVVILLVDVGLAHTWSRQRRAHQQNQDQNQNQREPQQSANEKHRHIFIQFNLIQSTPIQDRVLVYVSEWRFLCVYIYHIDHRSSVAVGIAPSIHSYSLQTSICTQPYKHRNL